MPMMNNDGGWDRMPATRRERKVLKKILAGFPEPGREKAEAGLSIEAQKAGSPRPFRFGRTRAQHFERDRSETDFKR
jgi:hypothetical protein